ncbi:DUF2087 domain-containing protein [Streptomyces sp. CS113]|uniref:DUF2087 domain-containing protein n=1 Tax=Streptomyces sp. CS113 TaxID=1982761 RepID=UPI00211AC223|nr:DUF2087 domain-containing protein [Streptomyces sp. CS113]
MPNDRSDSPVEDPESSQPPQQSQLSQQPQLSQSSQSSQPLQPLPPLQPSPDTGAAGGDARDGMIVRTFVRDGRLVRLPARWTRKKVVLRHIAEQTFVPGVEYPERTVDEKLRAWCEDGEVDHVTLRRHLVDFGHLRRSDGIYARPADSARTGSA